MNFGDMADGKFGPFDCNYIVYALDGSCYHVRSDWDDSDILMDEISERVKRPEVLDADGVPIRVGETVYGVESGEEVTVVRIDCDSTHPIEVEPTAWMKPCGITHQKPVFDADHVRICVGDVVWLGSDELIVASINNDGSVDGDYPEFHTHKLVAGVGRIPPSDLTHKQPDSLQRIIEDMTDCIAEWNQLTPSLMDREKAFERIRDRLCDLVRRNA